MVSSGPARSHLPCLTCTPPEEGHGVVFSCLNCFLAVGILYRFEYSVTPAIFLAKARGGTCTLAVSDPHDTVIHQVNYLLDNGFAAIMYLRITAKTLPSTARQDCLLSIRRPWGRVDKLYP